jgi:sugar lactone lactonase YvrE
MYLKQDAAIRMHARRLVWGSVAGAGLLLSACSGGGSGSAVAPGKSLSLGGKAMGGQQPVVGATVTLYAAGATGYGTGDSQLGQTTTDSNGNWHFSTTCPSGNPQLYVVATGGSAVGGSSNTAIGLSSALGDCNSASTQTGFNVDEVTTVASAFALAPFLDGSGQHLGTSAGNSLGLNNAVGNVSLLADLKAGTAQTSLPAGGFGSLPAATVNTLANILAACVNSTGAGSSQCSTLLSDTASGSTPTTTLQAALNIARNPGNNVAGLYALAGSPNAPFQTPAPLSAQPNDWTLAINFTGGSLDANTYIYALAIDAQGFVWITSGLSDSSVNGGNGMVLTLNSQGQQAGPFTDGNKFSFPEGIAVDVNGNVWVANNSGTAISGLNSSGASLSGSPFSSSQFNSPGPITTDQSGNVWVANTAFTNLGSGKGTATYVFKLSAANSYSVTAYAPPQAGTSQEAWTGVATDASGDLWLADGSGNSVLMHLSAANPATQLPGSPYSGGAGPGQPAGVGIDGKGNIWSPNATSGTAGNGVTKLVASSFSNSQFTSNGVANPFGVALDGAGKAWIANQDGNGNSGLVVLAADGSSLTGTTQWTGGGVLTTNLGGPISPPVAIDASGDVWVAGGFGNNVVEFIGCAAPVKTPLVGPAQLP